MIDTDQVLREYTVSCTRYLITDDKMNARDVYLKHLIESYSTVDYDKLIDIIGLEYISLPEDSQRGLSVFTMDVLASLLFAGENYSELRQLVDGVPQSNLIQLLLTGASAAEKHPRFHEDLMGCFVTGVQDRTLDKEEYINA